MTKILKEEKKKAVNDIPLDFVRTHNATEEIWECRGRFSSSYEY
jgi:hypothetical protein